MYEDDDEHDELDTVSCPNCGESVYEDSPRCPSCGEYITSSSGAFAHRSKGFRLTIVVIIVLTILSFLLTSILGMF
jgi:ribosomal protein S27AE